MDQTPSGQQQNLDSRDSIKSKKKGKQGAHLFNGRYIQNKKLRKKGIITVKLEWRKTTTACTHPQMVRQQRCHRPNHQDA
jgi:hypothetical protein